MRPSVWMHSCWELYVWGLSWVAWLAFIIESQGIILAPVYWNSSNPMFKTSKNLPAVEVNLFDEIDFVCPYYPLGSDVDEESVEYYIIYQVTLQEYMDCSIYSDNFAAMIVNCSNPNLRKRFTLLFESFQSIPNVPEYTPGSSYYYITTSQGPRDGLMNLNLGACYYNNMKLVIQVCCDSDLPQSPSQSDVNQAATSKAEPRKVDEVIQTASNAYGKASLTFTGTPSVKDNRQNEADDSVQPNHQGLSNGAEMTSRHFVLLFVLTISMVLTLTLYSICR